MGSVVIGDYKYTYENTVTTCVVVDKTKQSYGEILSSVTIDGAVRTVTYLQACFENCTSLTTAPTIPNTITIMNNCFEGCTSLTAIPPLPASVLNMDECFKGCTSLMTAPAFPTSVKSVAHCFDGCASLTTPPAEIPASVTSLAYCFKDCTSLTTVPALVGVSNVQGYVQGCTSLTTAPVIPANVRIMGNCFKNCTSLSGNIYVNSESVDPSSILNDNIFLGTANNIYIVDNVGSIQSKSRWRNVASSYSNVHYEADDNQIPSLSFTATRVSGMASETPSENGEYAFINATAIVHETYLPDGWSCNYDEGGENLTNDSVTQSPYWTRTDNDNVWTLKCWLSLGDTTKHTFTLQVGDEITDENDNVKASQLSTIITQIIPKAYKLVDYYHDPTTDTEGVSFGKFATDANLFDVDMPALFRDTLSLKDGNAVIRQLFDFVYPVGSYYETSDASFNPNNAWGGTWVLENAGLFHVASGGGAISGALADNGKGVKDGGESSVTLTSAQSGVPAHGHGMSHTHSHSHLTAGWRAYQAASGSARSVPVGYNNSDRSGQFSSDTNATASSKSTTDNNSAQNASQAHENRPPFIVVNRWHRTA